MSVLTKEARERLEAVVNGEEWLDRGAWEHDARLAMSHIDALEAERDALKARVAVLAEECKVSREAHPNPTTSTMPRSYYELALARAATDANGGLS